MEIVAHAVHPSLHLLPMQAHPPCSLTGLQQLSAHAEAVLGLSIYSTSMFSSVLRRPTQATSELLDKIIYPFSYV